MMGTWSFQVASPPYPMPGPTLSRLKASLRPRPHVKMAADPDGSLLFPASLSLLYHPTHSFSLCLVFVCLSSFLHFWFTSGPWPSLSPILFSKTSQVLPGSQKSPTQP